MPVFVGVSVSGFSSEFQPSHEDSLRLAHYIRREIIAPTDYIARWGYIPYWLVAGIAALALAGYIDSIVAGSHMFAFLGLLLAANYGWIQVKQLRHAYLMRRAQEIEQPRRTELRVDESGIHLEDELMAQCFRWAAVRTASTVPEGVFVLLEMSGCLLPNAAFADENEREQLVDFIRAHAQGKH